ncbi:hypothetical protein M5689_023926 [Euphorbia peplus]|nr:hypothetical protein M5689_023926 [Euphorbia peplus]
MELEDSLELMVAKLLEETEDDYRPFKCDYSLFKCDEKEEVEQKSIWEQRSIWAQEEEKEEPIEVDKLLQFLYEPHWQYYNQESRFLIYRNCLAASYTPNYHPPNNNNNNNNLDAAQSEERKREEVVFQDDCELFSCSTPYYDVEQIEDEFFNRFDRKKNQKGSNKPKKKHTRR